MLLKYTKQKVGHEADFCFYYEKLCHFDELARANAGV